MWQTHIAICGKSRRNLGKFSCNLWINSCNWPWELKMCHMFLVPVFETGSLRTFQLSTHTKASVSRRRGRYGGKKDTQKEWARKRTEGCRQQRDRCLKTEDGWIDRWGTVWGRGGCNRRMKEWQRRREIVERGKERGRAEVHLAGQSVWYIDRWSLCPCKPVFLPAGELNAKPGGCQHRKHKARQCFFTAQLHLIWPARAAEKTSLLQME